MEAVIRKEIVEVSKLLYSKGMVNAYEGNVSRKKDGLIYITPTSFCKGFLTEDMIVITDEIGNVVGGNRKPSSEIKLHLALYAMRPDIDAVVHAHPPYTTAYSLANMPIESKAYPEMILAFDKIPVAEYGTPSTDRIHAAMGKYIHRTDVVLMEKHGIVAVGTGAHETFFKMEAVESIAKTLTIVRMLGGEKPLPDEELSILYDMRLNNSGREKLE